MKEKDYGFFGVLKTEALDEILGDAELESEDDIFAAAMQLPPAYPKGQTQ
jgi:hypothetical protein